MERLSNTVSISDPSRLEVAHENLAKANEELLFDVIERLANKSEDVLYLDDLTVHTIDRAGNSPEDHINKKEIVSGDATARLAVMDDFGEDEKSFEISYEVHAGSKNGKLFYDPVEVTVEFK